MLQLVASDAASIRALRQFVEQSITVSWARSVTGNQADSLQLEQPFALGVVISVSRNVVVQVPEAFGLLLEPKGGGHLLRPVMIAAVSELLLFLVDHGEIVAQEVLVPVELAGHEPVPCLLQLQLQLPRLVAIRVLYQFEEHPGHGLLLISLVHEHLAALLAAASAGTRRARIRRTVDKITIDILVRVFVIDVAKELLILFLRVGVAEMLPELVEGYVTPRLLRTLAMFFERSDHMRLVIEVEVGFDGADGELPLAYREVTRQISGTATVGLTTVLPRVPSGIDPQVALQLLFVRIVTPGFLVEGLWPDLLPASIFDHRESLSELLGELRELIATALRNCDEDVFPIPCSILLLTVRHSIVIFINVRLFANNFGEPVVGDAHYVRVLAVGA